MRALLLLLALPALTDAATAQTPGGAAHPRPARFGLYGAPDAAPERRVEVETELLLLNRIGVRLGPNTRLDARASAALLFLRGATSVLDALGGRTDDTFGDVGVGVAVTHRLRLRGPLDATATGGLATGGTGLLDLLDSDARRASGATDGLRVRLDAALGGGGPRGSGMAGVGASLPMASGRRAAPRVFAGGSVRATRRWHLAGDATLHTQPVNAASTRRRAPIVTALVAAQRVRRAARGGAETIRVGVLGQASTSPHGVAVFLAGSDRVWAAPYVALAFPL